MKKRVIVLALMMLMLCACGKADRGQAKFDSFRESLGEAQEISLTADITANLDSEVFRCTLDCVKTPDSCRVTVLQPEELSGISADIENGTVHFDGVEIYVGELPDNMGPLDSVGKLIDALSELLVQEVYFEQQDEILAVRTYLDESTDITTKFDFETMIPLRAEIVREGKTVIICGISNFSAK